MDPSLEELVLLRLERCDATPGGGHVSSERSVPGLCDALDIDGANVGDRIELLSALSKLQQEGSLEESTASVEGMTGERTVYSLTDRGRERASEHRREIEADPPTVEVHGPDGTTVDKPLTDLDRYFEDAPLVRGLARVTERGVLSLDDDVGEEFVGRSAELDQVEALLGETETTLLISGPAGVGKTELITEATDRLEGAGVDTFVGWCRSDADESYQPFRDAMPAFPTPEIAPATGGRGELDVESYGNRRLSLFAEVHERLREAAGENGVVLFLEDVHWADAATIDLLTYLLEHVESDELIRLVCTYRAAGVDEENGFPPPEAQTDGENPGDRVRHIALDPFDRPTTRRLVETLLATRDVPDRFVDRVYDRTGGLPLFVEETITRLLDTDALDPDYGVYPEEIDPADVAETVESTIERRVDALDDPTREVLFGASVAGSPCKRAVLEGVLGSPAVDADPNGIDLRKRIDALVQAKFLTYTGPEQLSFTSEVLREAALNHLPADRQRALHAEVAATKEGHLDDPDSEAIAYHYEKAGSIELAIDHYLEAGDRALDLFAPEVAVERYERAADLARDRGDEETLVDALEEIGQAWFLAGNYDEAERYHRYVRERTADPDQRLRAIGRQANIYVDLGVFDECLDLVRDGRDQWDGETSSEGIFELLSAEGNVYLKRGELAEARDVFERNREIATDLDEDWFRKQAEHDIGTVAMYKNDYETAIDHFQRVVDAESDSVDWTVDPTLNNLASLHWRTGNLERSRELFDRALRMCQEIGNRVGEAVKLFNLGVVVYDLGEWNDAVAYYERTIDLASDLEMDEEIAFSKCYLAAIRLYRGHLNEAADLLEESLSMFRSIGSRSDEFYLRTISAELGFVRDSRARVREDADALLEIADTMGEPSRTVPGHAWHGRADLETGATADAIEGLERAVEFEGDANERYAIRARCGLAEAYLAADRPEDALESARKARRRARDSGIELLRIRSEYVLGRCHGRCGDVQASRAALEDALRRAEALDATLERARIEYGFGRLAAVAGRDQTATERFERARSLATENGFDRLERHASAELE